MTVLFVALGAAVGAPTRYFADRAIQRRTLGVFPWGTLAVNAAASLLLGAVVGAGLGGDAAALVGVGFCGALSTYSTFGYETRRLLLDRSYGLAIANVAGSVTVTVALAALGFAATQAIWA